MSSSPSVSFSMLCEGVRPEPRGKANILGFYGVLPHAHIVIGELGKQIPAIMFLVGFTGPTDDFTLGARIVSPDGSPLASTEGAAPVRLPRIEAGRAAAAGVGFAGLAFTQEGVHTIHFLVNGQDVDHNTFLVEVGRVLP